MLAGLLIWSALGQEPFATGRVTLLLRFSYSPRFRGWVSSTWPKTVKGTRHARRSASEPLPVGRANGNKRPRLALSPKSKASGRILPVSVTCAPRVRWGIADTRFGQGHCQAAFRNIMGRKQKALCWAARTHPLLEEAVPVPGQAEEACHGPDYGIVARYSLAPSSSWVSSQQNNAIARVLKPLCDMAGDIVQNPDHRNRRGRRNRLAHRFHYKS